MKKLLAMLFAMLLFSACALSDDALFTLSAQEMAPAADFSPVALYCGPTQGFYQHENQTIDLTLPFVCFGQDDCWVMAAQGTADAFGPVGWIEGGLFDTSSLPELSFEEGFLAMIEEDAAATDDPLNPDGAWEIILPRGTQVIVLAGYGEFLYVQTEIDGTPARVFVAADCMM